MEEILKIIAASQLPPYFFWPLLGSIVLLIALPHVRELLPWRRFYVREKMRLELLKLRYEIEALKKQHALAGLDESTFDFMKAAKPGTEKTPLKAEDVVELPPKKRIVYGSLGAVFGVLVTVVRPVLLEGEPLSAYTVFLLLTAILFGGLIAWQHQARDAREAFLVALAAVMVAAQLTAALSPPPPLPPA